MSDAITALQEQPAPVGVKPLVWTEDEDPGKFCLASWFAPNPAGSGGYTIEKRDYVRDGIVYVTSSNGPDFPSLEAAQSAVWAKHESAVLSALQPTPTHPDDAAVDRFAAAMKEKLRFSREVKGRSGWDDRERCSAEVLSRLLRDHVEKGDPLDAGNLAMMLHQRGEAIQPSPASPGPYEARICPNMPADCCDFGVISLTTGKEVCRVWTEADARMIASALQPSPAREEASVERIARMIARGLGHNDETGMEWERYVRPAQIIAREIFGEKL